MSSTAAPDSSRANSLRPGGPPASSPSAGAPTPLSRHQIVERLRRGSAWVIASVNPAEKSGTACLVDGSDRLLVTNYHVIARAEGSLQVLPDSGIKVLFPETRDGKPINEREVEIKEGVRYKVRVVDFDMMRDLAVLQVMARLPRDVEPLPLARESCAQGDTVHSIGNPVGDACSGCTASVPCGRST